MPRRKGRLLLAALAAWALAPAPALGQLGLDFSAPKKKEEKKKGDNGEPTVLAPLEIGKKGKPAPKGAGKERLEAAKKILAEGALETGAIALSEILRDDKLSDAHDDARYLLGKTLARLGLHHSALSRFDAILAKGQQGTKYFHTALEYVFTIGKKLKNEQPVVTRVAAFATAGFPPAYQDRFHFLLSKYEYERGRALSEAGQGSEAKSAFGEALRLASLVRPLSVGDTPASGAKELGVEVAEERPGDDFARARFVVGLVQYALGDQAKAVDAFKDVVRLTNPKKATDADPLLRESAFLQLARIHYENRQNRYAIFYYGKMPWGGENWLEGLWEASYAHYRIADYEKTLGNLLTLQSPYFRDEYFPESWVLKAIVYYENCRYPEARKILQDFDSIYAPVFGELESFTGGQKRPEAYFDLIDEAQKSTATDARSGTLRKIMRLAFTDVNIKNLVETIGEIEHEMDVGIGERRPEFRQSALAKELSDALTAERDRLIQEAGARARQKLEYELDQLRTLLAQALRIQIEVSRKEREALEGSLAAGGQVEVVRDLQFSYAVSDEHLFWPYEGEFWRDELGTYAYTLTKGCAGRATRADADR
ncbi:MAG TPA: adventurous gliding motility protein GltC [Anaeromyxobacteraceae bacterium]|nr:adventurous gliding motility protein GltC [Anaeromyxobacteraceae bacterium]